MIERDLEAWVERNILTVSGARRQVGMCLLDGR